MLGIGVRLCALAGMMAFPAWLSAQAPCLTISGPWDTKVAIMSDAPIQAELRETITYLLNGKESGRQMGKVLRDSAGRLRIETDVREADGNAQVTLEFPDGSRALVAKSYLCARICIYDRTQFQKIDLYPGRLRADTSPFYAAESGNPDIKMTCEDAARKFRSYDAMQGGLHTTQEVLGVQKIEGRESIGVHRMVYRKVEEEWQPIQEITFWYSVALGLELRHTEKDFQTHLQRQIDLISVDETEPDLSLFDIPAGYHVNPPSAETPCIVETAKGTAHP